MKESGGDFLLEMLDEAVARCHEANALISDYEKRLRIAGVANLHADDHYAGLLCEGRVARHHLTKMAEAVQRRRGKALPAASGNTAPRTGAASSE